MQSMTLRFSSTYGFLVLLLTRYPLISIVLALSFYDIFPSMWVIFTKYVIY